MVAAVIGYILQAQHLASTAYIAHDRNNLLRLHILANSDAPFDQDLKLAVRDALIPLLVATDSEHSATEVEQGILAKKQLLIERAEAVISAAGKDYTVDVEFGERYFDASVGEVELPAGDYRAIRVLIGAATGRNWWCVLFPPMCMAQEGVTAQSSATARSIGTQLPVEFTARYIPSGYLSKATEILQATWLRFVRYIRV
jgi:stage II sporulation protein R